MTFEVHFGCWGWLWISFGRPWGYPGHGLGSGLARGPHNGLDCTSAQAGAWFYQEPGIQNLFQVQVGFGPFGPYYQSNNCLIQGTFISELLDLRLRKVTVEILTGLPLRSLVAPSKEGPADIRYLILHVE